MVTLAAIDARIRELTGEAPLSRPFLCEGSPLECEVAEVGINPGSTAPFWPYWSVTTGCDKQSWLREHRRLHGRRTRTRECLEVFLSALKPLRCLELNLYDHWSSEECTLPQEKRSTRVFDYMLSVAKPRVLLVHGDTPALHVGSLLGVCLRTDCFTPATHQGTAFEVYLAAKHFRLVTYDYARQVGERIRQHLS